MKRVTEIILRKKRYSTDEVIRIIQDIAKDVWISDVIVRPKGDYWSHVRLCKR